MNITFARQLPPPQHLVIGYARDYRHLIVTWDEVRNPDGHLKDKVIKSVFYNIYKGNSRNGLFYKLNDAPLRTNRFEDYEINKNPNVANWYKVSSVYEDSSGDLIEGQSSAPSTFRIRNTDKWFFKVNERNYWILQNTGMWFDLYTRKYTGEKCPNCYDNIRGRSGSSTCPICYGTGFVGGYEPAFQLLVRLKPVDQNLGISNQMLVNDNSPGAWTITDTLIMNRDILISPDGTFYQVLSRHINHAGGFLFHQELRLRAYDPEDVIYNLKRTTLYPHT